MSQGGLFNKPKENNRELLCNSSVIAVHLISGIGCTIIAYEQDINHSSTIVDIVQAHLSRGQSKY